MKKTKTSRAAKLRAWVSNPRMLTFLMMFFCIAGTIFAQTASYEAGTQALDGVQQQIAKYLPYVQKLCYAIAGIVAVVGAISVYIKMNNEEQDVKKSIMMLVGACLFLIAAAQALPLFFGYSSTTGFIAPGMFLMAA